MCQKKKLSDEQRIKKTIERAKAYAIKRGYPQLADDFSQEAAIQSLTSEFINLEYVLTDLLRKEYGNTRSASGRTKSDQRRFGTSLDAPAVRSGDDSTLLHERIGSVDDGTESIGPTWTDGIFFTGRRQVIFELSKQDYTNAEIAKFLGVHEARISQEMMLIKKELESVLILKEKLDEYKCGLIKSEISIDWITL